jgi:hypothetical protein
MTMLSAIPSLSRSPLDGKRYVIQKLDPATGNWRGVSYAISTRNADHIMARLVRGGGRYRAIPATL